MEREKFGSRFAVIMALAGSAIGLGNIWRFPYMVGRYGGAAFIIVYILATALLAVPMLLSESLIGRRGRSNTFGAMEALAPGSAWKWICIPIVLTPLLVLSYYSVVGGWSVEYFIKAFSSDFSADAEAIPAMFDNFLASPWKPLAVFTVFLVLTSVIILLGVKKGIEKFSKITMPTLFLLIILIIVYAFSLPGSHRGIDYLIRPDWSKLTAEAVAAAMGQAFYSLSLGCGVILTYSSYVKEEENLLTSSLGTASADILFAMLAGFAVMPAVFACGIEPQGGPGLVFQSLPYVFCKMGGNIPWLGPAIAAIFFVSILIAALTSSISLMEGCVAYLVDETRLSLPAATGIIFLIAWSIGACCALSGGVFNFFDQMLSTYAMPFGALIFTLFAGWRMSGDDLRDEFTNGGSLRGNVRIYPFVRFLIRYIAPVGVLAIFLGNLIL